MAYSICFIDNAIPAAKEDTIEDTQRLNRSNLKLLLKGQEWDEPEVRDLVNKLVNDTQTWKVSAFVHPALYLNAVGEEGYRSDITIYDWDYPGGSDDPATKLLEVLKSTYTIVYVYSRTELKDEIRTTLAQREFDDYRDIRLDVLMKDEDGSLNRLLNKARDHYDESFSFRFGRELRGATLRALEFVLVEFGKHDKDFVKRLVAEEGTQETDLKDMIAEKIGHILLQDSSLLELLQEEVRDETRTRELLAILRGKVKDVLGSEEMDLSSFQDQTVDDGANEEGAKQLWSLRLYYKPSDGLVRRGDIVLNTAGNRHYLVITADCDLVRFWKKNFGYINLVPLYDISQDSDDIKGKLRLTRTDAQVQTFVNEWGVSSLTGRMRRDWVEGPFVCPFIHVEDELRTFIGFPKEMKSVQILPASSGTIEPSEMKKLRLTYEHWNDYKRIASISEPFLTALIQQCLDAISGFGAPDYPSIVRDAIEQHIRASLSEREPE